MYCPNDVVFDGLGQLCEGERGEESEKNIRSQFPFQITEQQREPHDQDAITVQYMMGSYRYSHSFTVRHPTGKLNANTAQNNYSK